MNPKVSVILPTYNGEKYIRQSIESVLSQSFLDWELIIIDDGSNDNTREIINSYIKNEKIIDIYQKNSGACIARNKGIEMSKGFYIAFIDDDDEWIDKDKLKKQIEFLDSNIDYVLVGTGGIIVNGDKNKIMDYNVTREDFLIRENILLKNPFILSSVLIRKETLIKVGLFLQKPYINAEDYNLWLRVGIMGKLANLTELMTLYTLRKGNTSSNHKKIILKSNILFIREFKDKYPNFWKALLFSYFKLYVYTFISLIKNETLKDKIISLLFKKYRNINF